MLCKQYGRIVSWKAASVAFCAALLVQQSSFSVGRQNIAEAPPAFSFPCYGSSGADQMEQDALYGLLGDMGPEQWGTSESPPAEPVEPVKADNSELPLSPITSVSAEKEELVSTVPQENTDEKSLSHRRKFLYDSLIHNNRPKNFFSVEKSSDSVLPKARSRLVDSTRLEELIQWCQKLLPAISTDDFRGIDQFSIAPNSLPLLSHLYIVDQRESLWKEYVKKSRKPKTEKDKDDFQALTCMYNGTESPELFSDPSNLKQDVKEVIRKMKEQFEAFSAQYASLEKARENCASLPPILWPLNSYPLTLVVCSSFEESVAATLQAEFMSALKNSRFIPGSVIREVTTDAHVLVLSLTQSARWRKGLLEGEIGNSWPDPTDIYASTSSKEPKIDKFGRRPYVDWSEPKTRDRYSDTSITTTNEVIGEVLKKIKRRKATFFYNLEKMEASRPQELFPLKASVLPKIKTAGLSHYTKDLLPSQAHLFYIDARESWREDSAASENGAVSDAVHWRHSSDGSPLIFTTSLYSVEELPVDSSSTSDFTIQQLIAGNEVGSEVTTSEDSAMKSLMLLAERMMKPECVEGKVEEPRNIDAPEKDDKVCKNLTPIPFVFLFHSRFSLTVASQVQRRLTRVMIRGGRNERNAVCVLPGDAPVEGPNDLARWLADLDKEKELNPEEPALDAVSISQKGKYPLFEGYKNTSQLVITRPVTEFWVTPSEATPEGDVRNSSCFFPYFFLSTKKISVTELNPTISLDSWESNDDNPLLLDEETVASSK